MLEGIFELQVYRGTAFHELEHMPRVVRSRIPVARPAREAWRLRCSFELEEHIAALGKRCLQLLEEHTVEQGKANEQTRRLVRCELVGEHLGGAMMGAVKSKDLVSEISSNFYTHLYDEEHGASFVVEMVKVAINVQISGRQWCEPNGEGRCFLCTRIELSVGVVAFGTLIEMQLERQMRASHAAFPEHADAFLERRASAKQCASPPSSPEIDVDLARLPANGPTVEEIPGPLARAAAAPRLNRWQIVWSLVLGLVTGGARKHRALSETAFPPAGGMVAVRVGVRHARLLLLCGCASGVDADEIVE